MKDSVPATVAASIFGVTKLQFLQLRGAKYFNYMVHPKKNYRTEWQFSKEELLESLAQHVTANVSDINDPIPVRVVFKSYGRFIADPLLTILGALRRGELKAACTDEQSKGIRSLVLDRKAFLDWYQEYRSKCPLMTVEEVAIKLGINGEFAYQLAKSGLMAHQTFGKTPTKWIGEEDITGFNERYILLSKFAKAHGLNSKLVIDQLSDQGIYPVDEGASEKLRQKVYNRAQMPTASSLTAVLG
jgi:hypothetical protein